eukprot:8963993-Karenia_brevis.AAC.1
MLERFHGGRLCASSRNMNLGPEHIGQERNIYRPLQAFPLPMGLPRKVAVFLAIVHMMPDSM